MYLLSIILPTFKSQRANEGMYYMYIYIYNDVLSNFISFLNLPLRCFRIVNEQSFIVHTYINLHHRGHAYK